MRQKLIIIGNGFDLHHDMKTKYYDYRQYLIDNGHKEIVNAFEYNVHNSDEIIELWSNVESNLGLLRYEDAYHLLKPYNDEDWHDSYHHDFQNEIIKMAEYWPGIRDYLKKWILSIDYTCADQNLLWLDDETNIFISFNYTNTLEKLYKIDKEKICYIHGDSSKDNDLLLGHGYSDCHLEWDNTNTDTDVRLIEAGNYMNVFLEKTNKHAKCNITKCKTFRYICRNTNIKNIYVFGYSYNDIDNEYLKYICKHLNATWHFGYHSEKDQKEILKFVKETKTKHFETYYF